MQDQNLPFTLKTLNTVLSRQARPLDFNQPEFFPFSGSAKHRPLVAKDSKAQWFVFVKRLFSLNLFDKITNWNYLAFRQTSVGKRFLHSQTKAKANGGLVRGMQHCSDL